MYMQGDLSINSFSSDIRASLSMREAQGGQQAGALQYVGVVVRELCEENYKQRSTTATEQSKRKAERGGERRSEAE